MRFHPLHVSPWIAGTAAGAGFAVLFTALAVMSGPAFSPGMLIIAVLTAALLSIALGLGVRRGQRRFAPDVAGMSRESATRAYWAAQGGKVPANPEIRAAAVRIAERHLASAVRTRILMAIALVCATSGLVLTVLSTLDSFSSFHAATVGLAALGLVYTFFIPRLLRRRVEILRTAA